jgi:hypothetical protein
MLTVTRNFCFISALTWWLAAPFLLLEYWWVKSQPDDIPLALYGAMVVLLLSLVVSTWATSRVPFISDVRDTLCDWGSGKANVTTFAYLAVLPLYLLGAVYSASQTYQQNVAHEADAPARAVREEKEAIRYLCDYLEINEPEARSLHQEFHGDQVKAVTEWRKRNAPSQSATPRQVSAPQNVTAEVCCPKCHRPAQPGKPLCVYCGTNIVAKVPCGECQRPLLSGTRCLFCGTQSPS